MQGVSWLISHRRNHLFDDNSHTHWSVTTLKLCVSEERISQRQLWRRLWCNTEPSWFVVRRRHASLNSCYTMYLSPEPEPVELEPFCSKNWEATADVQLCWWHKIKHDNVAQSRRRTNSARTQYHLPQSVNDDQLADLLHVNVVWACFFPLNWKISSAFFPSEETRQSIVSWNTYQWRKKQQ